VWLRVPGDIVFALGGLTLCLFALRLLLRGGFRPLPAGQAVPQHV
jgi:nitric oxide reductase subunit B